MEWSTSVEIAAPPELVWRVYTEVETWPRWTASVTRVERLDPGPLHVGQRVRIRQPKLPTTVWRLTDVVDGRSFTWRAGGPGARTTAHHVVAPAGDATLVHLSLSQRGPLGALVGRLTDGLTRRYLDLEATGLKRRCEGA